VDTGPLTQGEAKSSMRGLNRAAAWWLPALAYAFVIPRDGSTNPFGSMDDATSRDKDPEGDYSMINGIVKIYSCNLLSLNSFNMSSSRCEAEVERKVQS
jgi:hypothetical protein